MHGTDPVGGHGTDAGDEHGTDPGEEHGTDPWPGSLAAAAQVFVDDVDDPRVRDADGHHLARVLRLRPGEPVVVGDGRGRWRPARYTGATAGRTVEPSGPVRFCPRPSPPVTVAFVPVKGDRPEWVVQKLTECGVDHLVVLRSVRSVVRWEGPRAAGALDRLRRVAREAAAQSRRPWIPRITGICTLDELAGELAGSEPPAVLAVAQRRGPPPPPDLVAVAVGPEGGWDPSELSAGHPVVGLGPGVLRSETAAVVAGALLCARRDGVVGSPDPGRRPA